MAFPRGKRDDCYRYCEPDSIAVSAVPGEVQKNLLMRSDAVLNVTKTGK